MARTTLKPSDLYKIKTILTPRVSPDDEFVAAVSKGACRSTGTSYESNIRLYALPGGEPLGEGIGLPGVCNHSPRWAPDGSRLAFLAPDGVDDQLWIYDLRRRAMTRTSEEPSGVVAFDWAPDSRRVVLVSRTPDPSRRQRKDDLQLITTIREKVWSQRTWDTEPPLYCQLVILDLENGARTQITDGPWDSIHPAWSPTRDEVAFVSSRYEDPDPMIRTDIWVVDCQGASLRKLTRGSGPFGNPCWAPNGQELAAIGYERGEHPTYQTFNRVWLFGRSGEDMRCLTEQLDATCSNCSISDMRDFEGHGPGAISWPLDGGPIYFLAGLRGTTQLMSVDPVDQSVSQCTAGAHEVYAFAPLHKSPDVVVAKSTPTEPGDLWLLAGEQQPRRLTRVNPWLEGKLLADLEPIDVPTAQGEVLDGWIMKPPQFDSSRTYPAIMQVHRIMFAATFFFECQLMAASGFVVLYMNQHGSLGYGQSFALDDWTDRELDDLFAGADMLGSQPFVDRLRIGVCGGSNGGHLVYRLLAEGNAFAAGVGQRGIANFTSFFGTSDMGYHWTNWILGGYPWTLTDAYHELSPISSVDRINVPLLIVHSDRDTRVPIEQAEQLFVALKCLGKPVAFARFRSEGHNLSRSGRPLNRIARLEIILEWFHQHLM